MYKTESEETHAYNLEKQIQLSTDRLQEYHVTTLNVTLKGTDSTEELLSLPYCLHRLFCNYENKSGRIVHRFSSVAMRGTRRTIQQGKLCGHS